MRYLCVHGHCYQPPREDPWLDEIERQGSAFPYHDWNERIAAECYTPNTAARILDSSQRIARIVNNYSQTSFDFGPTLLAWLERKAPATYEAIRKADRDSQMRFSGHGSAMAHAYNHMILPLANRRDKLTQVRWGIQDFVHRFGREPEGMWLPETAVDLESLEIMAAEGIKFTILAPRQARAVRAIGSDVWRDVGDARIDPTQAYLCRLASGQSINVFFFDGPVSQAVSFEGLLDNGEKFISRLLSAYSDARSRPELVHVVTDGEVYGHHKKQGEMALAYTLEQMEARGLARITNYGEYLERHPPSLEVEIIENTSWSCAHGVDRWQRHCGCHAGHAEWSQRWRRPLRDAFDWLRDTVAEMFERNAADVLKDPWAARDDYIHVLLDPTQQHWAEFKRRNARRYLGAADETRLWMLLEIERHAMLMYTSCGWFFDELSGIETVQVIRHAARVVDLVQTLFHRDLEPDLLLKLELAKCNVAENRDGARIYARFAKPLRLPKGVDLPFAKRESTWCQGLGLLHRAIRNNHLRAATSWARPQLEGAHPIIEKIIESEQAQAELAYTRDCQQNGSFLRFLREHRIPLSGASLSTAERALNSMLQRAFKQDEPDSNQIRALFEEARALGVNLDRSTLDCIAKKTERLARRCAASPDRLENLAQLSKHVEMLASTSLSQNTWAAQNLCYSLLETRYPEMAAKRRKGDASAETWLRQFQALCEKLSLRMPDLTERHAAAASL